MHSRLVPVAGQRVRRIDGKGVPPFLARRRDVAPDDVAYLGGEVERSGLDVELATTGARHRKEIAHEPVHPVDLTLDRFEIALEGFQIHGRPALLRAPEAPELQLRQRFERREWRSQ